MRESILVISTLIALTAAAADARKSPLCGVNGYDTNTEGYDYYESIKYANCAAKCVKDSNCLSISYGDGGCNLYNVNAASNFVSVTDSPYTFYDRACLTSSTTTSQTSTSSVKSSATTTKSTLTTTLSTVSSKTSASTTQGPTSKTTTSTKTASSTSNSSSTKSTSSSSSPTKTSTTSKKVTSSAKTTTSSSTKSSSTSATSSSALSPPCPLPTFTVTNFLWFNSSHNALCAASAPDVGDGTGCLDENGNWCDPNLDKNCFHCGINVCYTGLPTQPVGYGPPDYVKADVSNIDPCYQSDPGTTPRHAVGDGELVRCGGSQYQMSFLGDSNVAKSHAYFNFQNQYFCPDGKAYYMAYGSGNTSMTCTYDSGKNATCTLDNPSFDVAATRFDNVGYSKGN